MSRSKEDFSIKQEKSTIYLAMKLETWWKAFLIAIHKKGSLLKVHFHINGSNKKKNNEISDTS